jgi:hypothetical protein
VAPLAGEQPRAPAAAVESDVVRSATRPLEEIADPEIHPLTEVPGQSLRATSGPVIRWRRGIVAAMIPSDTSIAVATAA